MLDSAVKKKLLKKLDNLITEKHESELLKEEFVNWFNSGKPFEEVMNDSEKEILRKYPNLVIKKVMYFSLYNAMRWGDDFSIISGNIFPKDELYLIDHDNAEFYSLTLNTYPAIFDLSYSSTPTPGCNKEMIKIVGSKLNHILRVRKKYLEKLVFIKRVLDSRELTLTVLKRDYKDLYDLYRNK